MKDLNKTLDIKIPITPEEVAKLFCEMDGDEQAIFFSTIASEAKKWTAPFVFQLEWITNSKELTDEAREIMREIGNYSQKPTTV